ncbi:ATPase, partial [hydrothermal vent metagenome]
DNLCREPRGTSDFLAIARQYHAVMIDSVPVMLASERNEAKRFILLIDVLYDNHCRLVISADGPPDALYQVSGGREAFEFERTASRLIEMQSREYNEACERRR